MPLPLPNLDDRDYEMLREAALKKIEENLDTNWNDLAPGDPGIVLLEAFVFLTEQMIYRLNRLPEKVYTAFLRLLGVTQFPPTAARVLLQFSNGQGAGKITLPPGTRVGTSEADGRPDQPVFLTAQEVTLPEAGQDQAATVEVMAYQCERVEEELGISNGLPGQAFQIQQPPITAPLGNWLDLVVAVEVDVPPKGRLSSVKQGSDGRYYSPWSEVRDFSETGDSSQVFTVDRQMGTIQFAPAARRAQEERAPVSTQTLSMRSRSHKNGGKAQPRYYFLEGLGRKRENDGYARQAIAVQPLGEVPEIKRRIRVWYSHSLGEAGNLPAGKLTNLLDIPGRPDLTGVQVTNPRAAWGGMDGEQLADALVRGPYEAFARQNVITIRDYEETVKQHGRAIARAHAYALQDMWKHAKPGTVELALVPALPTVKRQQVKLQDLLNNQHDVDFQTIENDLIEKTPVGTHSRLVWAHYKEVSVEADLVLDKNTDPENAKKVYDDITQRLYDLISPLPAVAKSNGDGSSPLQGWPFGQDLRVAQVYQAILAAAPQIKLIERLVLKVTSAPEKDIHSLAADFFQPHTWYAASGSSVFRSINDGAGWEEILVLNRGAGNLFFPHLTDGQKPKPRQEQAAVIRPNPDRPGLVALATSLAGHAPVEGLLPDPNSALYLSADCGETWYCHTRDFSFEIKDMAWMMRASQPILLLATTCGLFELDIAMNSGGQPDLETEAMNIDSSPHLVPVDKDNPELPLNAVVVLRFRSNSRVAVAAKNRKGVFLSYSDDLIPVNDHRNAGDAGNLKTNSKAQGSNGNSASDNGQTNFAALAMLDEMIDPQGLKNVDIRCLGVQTDLNHTYNFLWAGAMAIGNWAKGCYRWSFDQAEPVGNWVSQGWTGGSCHALAFQGPRVLAATQSGGVLEASFDPDHWNELVEWKQMETGHLPKQLSDENDQLGSDDQTGFEPLTALETSPAGEVNGLGLVMTGGEDGIFRWQKGSGGAGLAAFERISRSEFQMMKDSVTIPSNWLLVSKDHRIGPPGGNAVTDATSQAVLEGTHESR